MKPTERYYAYGLGSDIFEKIRALLSDLKHPNLEKLKEQEKPDIPENSIVFYNADLAEAATILEASSTNQLIAIAESKENAIKAVQYGATDYILISDLDKLTVSKSLVVADRLRESRTDINRGKDRLDDFLEQSYDGVIIQNSHSEILFVSPEIKEIFGREGHEMVGSNALFLISSGDQKEYKEALRKLTTQEKTSVKLKLKTLNAANESKWYEAVIISNGVFGEAMRFTTALRRIREENKVEHELSLAELKYRTLIETTSDGLWNYDVENNKVNWSDSFFKILGFDIHDEITPQHIPELAHPNDRKRVEKEMEEKMYAGRPYKAEFRIRKKNGQYIWIIAEGNGIKNGKGELIWILGVIKNIDKRKRAELDLAISKERIENIANGINGVLARHREYPNGKVENLYISSGVKEIWGLSAEEVMANPEIIWLRLEETELKNLESAFYEAVNNDEKLDHIYSFKHEDGNQKFLHVVALPKKMKDGVIEWDSITTDVTSIKNDEEKSYEQQLLLENILYNIDGAVQRYKVNVDGKRELLFMSNGFEKLTGIPVKDALQNFDLIRKQIPTEDRIKIQRSIERSIKNLSVWEQTWRITDRNGNSKWLQGSGIPMKKPDGSVVIDSVITDITKLKQATTELSSAKQEFRLAAKAAHLGLWKFDPINDILEWDEQMFKVFGIDPREFSGKRQEWIDALHPDDKSKSINALVDAVNTGADLDFQFRIIRRDNQETRHIRASANSVVNSNGEAIFLVGLNWDVSHIVRAQEKITESNNRYALASKASQDAIWDLDLKTNILKWSPSFNELFEHNIRLDKDHLEDWGALVHPDDYDRVVLGLEKFIAAGKNKWEEEYRFKKGNGEYAHVIDRGYIVRDYTGKATRMVGSMRDITANTEYLNAIKAQNEKLKKIAWTQSHELRGPLTRIMGLTDLVRQDGFRDITVDEFLTYLNSATDDLDRVIKEIVDGSEEVGIYDPDEKK